MVFDMRASLAERFWAKVDKSGDCWLWTGHCTTKGYGTIRPGGTAPSRGAHVVSWELAHGRPVGDGLQVNHSCDNPPCVNPDHLYEGTQADNMRDKEDRGRWVHPHGHETHCPQGHAYEGRNLIERTRVLANGRVSHARGCRACNLEAVRRYKARFVA